jgi:putative ABC transport system permease protein
MSPIRELKNNWLWHVINAIGLCAALACIIMVSLYVRRELSFDRFHRHADRIYRVTMNTNTGATSMHAARVQGSWPAEMARTYPEIQEMARLIPTRRPIIRIGENIFTSEKVFATDSTFFHVFDFKVIAGDVKNSFRNPNCTYITRSIAEKYFHSTDVLGREINILWQQDQQPVPFVVEGVMEDMPENSHFHADILVTGPKQKDDGTWAFTYFLMKQGADVRKIEQKVRQKWVKEIKNGDPVPFIQFQKLTDIHLHSHLTREIERNNDIRSIVLLLSGTFIVLLITLVNYLNLSRVLFLRRLKSYKVKLINGATKLHLSRELIINSLFSSLFSVAVALLICHRLDMSLGLNLLDGKIYFIAAIILGYILLLAALSLIPLFTSKVSMDIAMKQKLGGLYTYPLVLQFCLAIIAIAATFVLSKQIAHINNLHPASQNSNMLVIRYNRWDVSKQYDILKSELLKNPDITDVTCALEEPGGDINDSSPVEMEGIPVNDKQPLNIFTVDTNFFTFLNIKPLAGTTKFGDIPGAEWEQEAIEINMYKEYNLLPEKVAAFEKTLESRKGKYILNMSALRLLGISNPEEAIGKKFRLKFFIPCLTPDGEVIGVVPDFHYTDMHKLERPLVIFANKSFSSNFIISFVPARQKEALATINGVWKKLFPEFPLEYSYINDSYRGVYTMEYNQSRVLSLFALISILLSALGIFAIASFNIQQRTKEIGIRKVNGAKIGDVLMMLNGTYIRWMGIAFLIAVPVTYYAMNKWLENFAYKTALSWWIFALAGLLALIVALLTISWQSWRAATRNPVEALRYE